MIDTIARKHGLIIIDDVSGVDVINNDGVNIVTIIDVLKAFSSLQRGMDGRRYTACVMLKLPDMGTTDTKDITFTGAPIDVARDMATFHPDIRGVASKLC